MKIIEVPRMQTAMAENIGHVRALSRRPGPITALPELTYVRPKVMIEGRHVAAYSKVCGFTKAHGVPMLYPHLQAFPLAMRFMISRNFPWPTMGMVHLANRARQYQRIDVGDELRYEMDTGELQSHEKGQIVVLHARALRAGELVWDSSWYLLRLAVRNPQGLPFESSLVDESPLSHQADFYAAGGIGRRYGGVSGDINPIHMWALTAKMLGFRKAIAHGMWTKARALATLMPREPVEQAEATVEFKTPLFLPARASLWAAREEGNALFEVRNAKGDKPHLRGRVTF